MSGYRRPTALAGLAAVALGAAVAVPAPAQALSLAAISCTGWTYTTYSPGLTDTVRPTTVVDQGRLNVVGPHSPTGSCLAVQNFRKEKRIRIEEQVCSTCDMRAYAAVVVVELPAKHANSQAALAELGDLIELANRYLSRLFKVEHYYNRMRDMEITIAQMSTVMQSTNQVGAMEMQIARVTKVAVASASPTRG